MYTDLPYWTQDDLDGDHIEVDRAADDDGTAYVKGNAWVSQEDAYDLCHAICDAVGLPWPPSWPPRRIKQPKPPAE